MLDKEREPPLPVTIAYCAFVALAGVTAIQFLAVILDRISIDPGVYVGSVVFTAIVGAFGTALPLLGLWLVGRGSHSVFVLLAVLLISSISTLAVHLDLLSGLTLAINVVPFVALLVPSARLFAREARAIRRKSARA